MAGILNLNKNDILDLTKKDPSLKNILVGAGWDVAKKGFFSAFQKDFDLDLSAILLDKDNKTLGKSSIIYFGNQVGQGIRLHGDNRTGQGDGDDEKISISLNSLPSFCERIIITLSIYEADKRNQSFDKVKNAYIRLLNEDKGNEEICRYNLSEEGKDNTAIIFAELTKNNGDWQFKAVGNLLKGSVSSLYNMYK